MKRILFILDIIICIGSYIGLYYFKTGSFIPQGEYLTLFWVYILLWLFFSIYYKMQNHWYNFTFQDLFISLLFTSAYTLFFLTLIVSLTDLSIVSRLFLIGIVAAPFLIELPGIILIRRFLSINGTVLKDKNKLTNEPQKATHKLIWLIGGLIILVICFIMINVLKHDSFEYGPLCERVMLVLISTWIISVGLTGKYKFLSTQNLYYQIAPFIKAGFIMFILTGFVYYFFRLESLPRFELFGTTLVYTILETVVFVFVFLGKSLDPRAIVKENVLDHKNGNGNIFGQEPLPVSSLTESTSKFAINIQSLFKRVSVKESGRIIQFLLNNIDRNYTKNSVTLLSTISLDNINVLKGQSQNLLINLHKMNDIRRLNEHLITCHSKIMSEGMLVGGFVPLERARYELRSKMPKFIFTFVYPLHFLFYRVFPKLPKIRHLYFVLTNGMNRVISKAEVFGRLNFCGYKVVAEKMINNTLYFVAKKLNTVSTEETPSYSPIVKLKRVGLDGKIITIYKFRTMHPYSEFIQKDVFENHSLNPYGKINNDFRITSWGRLFRKLWIDELPQLYNWIRGDITLVGVRALSEHYLSLYPKDLQELRTQLKPGLVPPYYADMPKSFDEIIESERKYLEKKKAKPFSTDFIYLSEALMNIVFRGARSS
jgi:hypothetical protein